MMNRQTDKRLTQELEAVSSAAEAAELAEFAHSLTPEPPKRSRQAHNASWHMVESRIDELSDNPARISVWKNWRFILAPAALAAIILFVMVSVFAQGSLPGSVTYSLKRGWEGAQLTLARTPAQKADACSRQMKRRANELALVSHSTTSTVIVQNLSASIVDEASEFDDYISQSGENADRLKSQRQRDIAYTISALQTAEAQLHNQEQRKIIADTIDILRIDA